MKINKEFINDAYLDLEALQNLQGAPLTPRIYAFEKNNDNLWILFEKLTLKPEKIFTACEYISMIRDSAITLRIFENEAVEFRPIKPQTSLFNENGNLKFLDIGPRGDGSILACLFSSLENISQEVIFSKIFKSTFNKSQHISKLKNKGL